MANADPVFHHINKVKEHEKMYLQDEEVQFKKLHPDAIVPTRSTPYSAGFDLYALEDVTIDPTLGNILVPTGIAVQLPLGTYGRIAMRSGLAVKQHLTVSAGVIDLDYTGAIGVVVCCTKVFSGAYDHNTQIYGNVNLGYIIKKGERFAQLVVERACYAPGVEVSEFKRSYQKHEGFGSTGK
jgi:dUTP pyrophosphatase